MTSGPVPPPRTMEGMCERIPLSAVPPTRGELRYERRAVLAIASLCNSEEPVPGAVAL